LHTTKYHTAAARSSGFSGGFFRACPSSPFFAFQNLLQASFAEKNIHTSGNLSTFGHELLLSLLASLEAQALKTKF